MKVSSSAAQEETKANSPSHSKPGSAATASGGMAAQRVSQHLWMRQLLVEASPRPGVGRATLLGVKVEPGMPTYLALTDEHKLCSSAPPSPADPGAKGELPARSTSSSSNWCW